MLYFPTFFLSLFITITLIPIFKTMAMKMHAVDIPNERKVHTKPMPKVGGIAFAFGALLPVLFLNDIPRDRFVWSLMIGAWIIVVFGFADDVKNLGYKTKFLGQIVAALIVVFYGEVSINNLGCLLPEDLILPPFVAIPLTLISIIGVTNAINLADGLDGLAGGISLLSFVCIGYLAYRCGDDFTSIAFISFALVGALFGFLRFNTFPSSIFMGDAGSQLIGFLAITLSLKLTQGYAELSPILPLLLLGFPVLDTLTVMAERKRAGFPMFVADKNHFHHKLMKIGLYHSEAVFFIYVVQSTLVTFAFNFRANSEWFLLAFYLVFTGTIFLSVFIANEKGFQFQRPGFIDRFIKEKLRPVKAEHILIKASFTAVEIILPFLLIFSIFLPLKIIPLEIFPLESSFIEGSWYISGASILLALLIFVSISFIKKWSSVLLRVSLYLLIPYIIYIGDKEQAAWVTDSIFKYYNISFIVLSFFVVLTVKYTRRTTGFKVTPMDFIILFAALVIPNLPDQNIEDFHIAMTAMKIIVLFFSVEVWICELRGKLAKAEFSAIAALTVLAVRGFT